jgi:hypothetical protein
MTQDSFTLADAELQRQSNFRPFTRTTRGISRWVSTPDLWFVMSLWSARSRRAYDLRNICRTRTPNNTSDSFGFSDLLVTYCSGCECESSCAAEPSCLTECFTSKSVNLIILTALIDERTLVRTKLQIYTFTSS